MDLFKDLKVIELANVLAGPAVGSFFAELGATVVKVENKRVGGDMTRSWKVKGEDENAISAYYASVNYGKTIDYVDLKDISDRNRIYDLVKEADIVISNYKLGADVKLGMDYGTLIQYNQDLIYGRITGFGEESDRVAYDIILQAETGYISMNGQPDSEPTKIPVAMIDVLAAHQLKEGLLTALLKKERTGKGSYVTTSLYDAAISGLINQGSNWLMAGHIPQPIGSLHPNIAPYGEVIKIGEKSIVLAIGTDKQFKTLCEILSEPGLAEDPKFETNASRVVNRTELKKILESLFANYDPDNILQLLHAKQVPVGVIKNVKQVFDEPRASNLILEEEIEGTLTKRPRSAVFDIK